MYQNEMLNYFPTFTKTPIYIDNTNTILLINHSLVNIIINFIKNTYYVLTGIIISILHKFKLFCFQYILTSDFYYEKLIVILFIISLSRIYSFKNNSLTNKIKELEDKIKYLYKKECFLENDVEKYTQFTKKSQEEMEQKIKLYQKEMKKMKKEINKYN